MIVTEIFQPELSMNIHRQILALTMALLAFCGAAHGALVYDQTNSSGFANSGYVPDNNPSGWANSQTVSGLASGLHITDVRVGLNLSGGWNGDLYGYLQYQPAGGGSATLLVLLDRVGDPGISGGYGDTGFSVMLSDAGAHPIENYQSFSYSTSGSGQLQGTWQANDGSATFAGTFGSLDPNGTWTLFLADRATGDQSQVTSWSLQLEAVPEPTTWALLGFGTVFAGAGVARRWQAGRAPAK